MRHAAFRGLEKNAQDYDDEYDGLYGRSVDDSTHCPYSPNSSAEYYHYDPKSNLSQHSLTNFVSDKKSQSKKKGNKAATAQLKTDEEQTFDDPKSNQIRGRLPSRDSNDIQFDFEADVDVREHAETKTQVCQRNPETLPSRIETLKISERNDRSVSPQKRNKSSMNSPSVTPRQGVSPVAASRRQDNPSASVSSANKRRIGPIDRENALREYQKRLEGRDLINLVVIGHVDAGKSTLMGHLLVKLKVVDDRTMHKNRVAAAQLGKESFSFAFVLDESEEERQRGVTMDIAQAQFKTNTKIVNLVDAPGHKDFIPNMINGAAQADVAILVVDSRRGEFETGFELGGQTREHALLVRSLGVSQLICAVNKMDAIDWSQERFEEIVKKLSTFLKSSGYKDSDVMYVPVSGWTGENLIKPLETPVPWYSKEVSTNSTTTLAAGIIPGATLIDLIDRLRSPERPISKPFRFCVNDIFRASGVGANTLSVAGRIDCGGVEVNDRLLLRPSNDEIIIKSIQIENNNVTSAFAGDAVVLNIQGVDPAHLFVGNVICDPEQPIPSTNVVQARVIIFNISTPILPGTPVAFHFKSLQEQARITRLIEELDRGTGELKRRSPRLLTKNSSGIIEITLNRPICCELYSDCKELGRVTLRNGGITLAAGIITKIGS